MKARKQSPAKLQHAKGNRLAWQALVRYANTGDAAALNTAYDRCAPSLFKTHRKVFRMRADLIIESNKQFIEPMETAAPKYHSMLRSVLTWLAVPDIDPELAQRSGDFVWYESQKIRWMRPSAYPRRANDAEPRFFIPTLMGPGSAMSPICQFLLDRIRALQEDNMSLEQAIPIQVCERDGCGNFVLPERHGRKRFCSDRCRALSFQSSRDDWNEYMRKYRKTKRDMKARQAKARRKK